MALVLLAHNVGVIGTLLLVPHDIGAIGIWHWCYWCLALLLFVSGIGPVSKWHQGCIAAMGTWHMAFMHSAPVSAVLCGCWLLDNNPSGVQVQVTRLVEERMLQQPSRAEAYRQYQRTTPMWFPGISTFQRKRVA